MAKDQKKQQTKLHGCFRPFRDYLITMVPIAALSAYMYGPRVLVMLLIATMLSMLCDILVCLMRGRRYDVSDISSITFSWIFTMLLPVSVSYGVLIFGVLAVVLLGKHAFGGWGCYPFNPAAFGFALTAVSYPNDLFMFPRPFTWVGLGWNVSTELYHSPAYSMMNGGVPTIDRTDLLLGDYSGSIGATFCLVTISCLVLLIAHGAMTWHIPISYMLSCAVWAFLFPRVPASRLFSVMLEVFCCGIPFAAAYLVPEPTTSPKTERGKIVYGILAGVMTMLFTRSGSYESGVCFSLLLTAPLGGWLSRLPILSSARKKEGANGKKVG